MIFGQTKKRIFTEPGFEFKRSTDTPPNTIIVIGGLVGITTDFVKADTLGWASAQGTFNMTAAAYSALTFAKGDTVKVTVADHVGTIAAAGTASIGLAVEAKAAGTNDVVVMLVSKTA